MAWYPAAVRKPIGRSSTRLVDPQRVTLHTAVVNATSLAKAFASGPHSHFYVRQDGTVEQYTDTLYRAAADLQGNDNSVSIESWDGYGTPLFPLGSHDVPAWTPAQVASLVKLIRWLWEAHPSIPRRLATNSKIGPSSHGVAWHRLGVPATYAQLNAGVSQTGGMLWSRAVGKTCPGTLRIAQIPGILAAALPKPAPTPPTPVPPTPKPTPVPEEDIMASIEDLRTVVREELAAIFAGKIPVSAGTDRAWETTRDAALAEAAELGKVRLPDGTVKRTDDVLGELAEFLAEVREAGEDEIRRAMGV